MKGDTGMDMIDRYVYDVGRRLPAKQREDIRKELKSLLMDALDARTGGKEATQDDVTAVLREFGSPADAAAKYAGDRYVIGPRLYPFYRTVMLIVLGAVAFGLAVSFIVGAFTEPIGGQNLGQLPKFIAATLGQFLATVFSGALSAFGGVTLTFLIIERAMEASGKQPNFEAMWDPADLPPVPKRGAGWKPAESITSLVFCAVLLVLINFIPEIFSFFIADAAGQVQRYPLIAPEALKAYLPLWSVGLALTMLLHTALLIRGRWRLWTNLGNIAAHAYDIAVLSIMMSGPSLLVSGIAAEGAFADTVNRILPVVSANLKWVFILGIMGAAAEVGKSIYRLVRHTAAYRIVKDSQKE